MNIDTVGDHPFTEPTDSLARPARRARLRIQRTRLVMPSELSAGEREALCAQTYAIYSAYKVGVDRATFDGQLCANRDSRIELYYGEDGALVGFFSAALQRVEVEGRTNAVFSGLTFIDTRYSGAMEVTSFGLREAIRFRMREPFTPLWCMGVIMSPASYRRFVMTMPKVYPARGTHMPDAVGALMRETARRRGLAFLDEDRWLVRGLGAPRHPDRLKTAKSLDGDPDARFYLDQNPHFDKGVAMVISFRLDLLNLAGAGARYAARTLLGP